MRADIQELYEIISRGTFGDQKQRLLGTIQEIEWRFELSRKASTQLHIENANLRTELLYTGSIACGWAWDEGQGNHHE